MRKRRKLEQSVPLKVKLRPLPDELLSSWITRIAFAHHITPTRLFTAYLTGDGSAITRRDLDFYFDQKLFNLLSTANNISHEEIFKMSLRSQEGYLCICNESLFPPKLIRLLSHKNNHYGLMYCPLCLQEDATPYYRKEWRFAFVHTCPKHNIMLLDRCPQCHSRVNVLKMESLENIVYCHKCGEDYRKAPIKYLTHDELYGHTIQLYFLEGLNRGYFQIGDQQIQSGLFFATYNNLKNILNRGKGLQLPSFTLLHEYKKTYRSVGHITTYNVRLIQKNFLLSTMVGHLFQDFPRNFLEFISLNKLNHRHLIHDMSSVPFWYKTLIDNIVPLQDTVGRTIDKNEVLGAISYLEKHNLRISQKSVAKLIGCHYTLHKGFLKIFKSFKLDTTYRRNLLCLL